ncbi:MAG: hypothetical protein WC474_02010 [Hydrogenophilaceae bacterium]
MQSKTHKSLTLIALLGSLASLPALADHNSVWGPGFANMPNDVHNTRIEDDLDQDAWTAFVQYGAGAATPNRYLVDDTSAGSGAAITSSRGGRR